MIVLVVVGVFLLLFGICGVDVERDVIFLEDKFCAVVVIVLTCFVVLVEVSGSFRCICFGCLLSLV